MKRKGSNGAAVCDSEAAVPGNTEQMDDRPATRAPAPPAIGVAPRSRAHRHACIRLTTPRWPPLCTDGAKLPTGVTETIHEWTRTKYSESKGLYELHDHKPVAPVITHELLIEVNKA